MNTLKFLRLKTVYFLLLPLLVLFHDSIEAQTLDLKGSSSYKGYQNSVENGFLSQFSHNKQDKTILHSENSFKQNNVDYKFHGITGDSMNIPRAQCSDLQGNIYITGSSGNIENNSGDITTIKINPAGEIVWTLRIPSPEFTVNSGSQIIIDNDGFIYVVGYTWNQASTDIVSIKISNDGQLVWQTIIGNPNSFDVPTALTVNDLGELFIAGITSQGAKVTYYISKISDDGQLIWENIDDDFPDLTWNEPRIIHHDSNGDIIVCGSGYDQDFRSKTVTAKFSGDGALVWRKIKTFQETVDNESQITDGWPTDFVIDNNNNIYITNNFTLEFFYSSMTFKYDVNGIESWNCIHQAGEKNTRIKQIFFNQNLLLIGGYHYDNTDDGFIVSALNLDGSLNWNQISTNQLFPQKFYMSLNNNKVHLNSVSFHPITFGNIFNSSSYAIDSGNLINDASLNFNNQELGFSLNEFFQVINSNDSKSIVLSTFYSQFGNVYEVLKINNLDNSTVWNTKFMLQNSTKTNVLESVSDSNSNVFSLARNLYVANDNLNLLNQKSYLIKHDAAGNFISKNLIVDSQGLAAVRLAVDNDDNVVVTIKEDEANNIKLKKFTNTMQLVWNQTLPVTSLQSEIISVDKQNNIYLVTTTKSQNSDSETSINVSKFSPTGVLLFSNAFQPENTSLINNFATKALFDKNDNIIIGGTSSPLTNTSFMPTLISISSTGLQNYFKAFPIQNNVSGLVDLLLINNEFYLAISSRNMLNDFNGIHMLKSNDQGQLIWQRAYFTDNENIFLNKLLYSTNNNTFYTVNFKMAEFARNIEVISWNLNGTITGFYTLEDNNFYQDAFSDNQYIYVLSQNQSEINFPKRLLNWVGPFISSKITKLNFDLTLADSIDFVGSNYSMFEPKQLIPLNNSNLLISGRLFNEELFFEGLKFFSIPYQPILGMPSFPENEKSMFVCYPNPTSDFAHIFSKNEIKEISVFNSTGEKIISSQTSNVIDVSKLASGIYLVKGTNSEGKSFTTKMIKK